VARVLCAAFVGKSEHYKLLLLVKEAIMESDSSVVDSDSDIDSSVVDSDSDIDSSVVDSDSDIDDSFL
jgi:hypothetical protein